MRLSKVEKFYIDGKFGSISDAEMAKDLGRKTTDASLVSYLKKLTDNLPKVKVESPTFKMFGNTKKGAVISNQGVSEVGDDSRKTNEKKLPPYVRRI